VTFDPDRTFHDYLNDYQAKAQNEEVNKLVEALGVDKGKLTALMETKVTEANLNEYGRFDELKATIDKQKAKLYLESVSGEKLSPPKVNMRAATLLRKFILEEGFEMQGPIDIRTGEEERRRGGEESMKYESPPVEPLKVAETPSEEEK